MAPPVVERILASLRKSGDFPAMASERYIVVLPLVVDQKPLGLFYVDGDREGASKLTPPVLNYLKVLRGQAVVAIHQRSAPARRR